MTPFRTVIAPEKAPFCLDHHDQILLIGSCFTEHIGQRMVDRKLPVFINPFGIVYNPFSMVECLELLLTKQGWPSEEWPLFEHQGLWHSWLHHSRFSDVSQEKTLENIDTSFVSASNFLKKATCLIMTLGTADVFRLVSNHRIVANNHKMPSALFLPERLSVTDVSACLTSVLIHLKAVNPALKVILSVSPVRHLRQGAIANQRSKAVLQLAIEDIISRHSDTCYFPAYELVMDDLRDYRFYADDMIHPTTLAQDYIWNYFGNMFFTDSTQSLNENIARIVTASQHRPFHPNTPQHHQFLKAQLKAIEALTLANPHLDFTKEKSIFEAGMVS